MKELKSSKRKNSGFKVEMISPETVSFPLNLGGGCGGCCVVSYFDHLLTSEGSYFIISVAEIVEQTRDEPYFIEICKNSECYHKRKNRSICTYALNVCFTHR